MRKDYETQLEDQRQVIDTLTNEVELERQNNGRSKREIEQIEDQLIEVVHQVKQKEYLCEQIREATIRVLKEKEMLTEVVDRLDKDVRDLPHVYVAKDDFRNELHEIKQGLQRIFDKLDEKADK